MADHEHPTARGHRRRRSGVDGPSLVRWQVQVDDDDEVERPGRRRPVEEVALQPFDRDAGGIRLRPSVGKPDRRPVYGGRAPALPGQPDGVGAAPGSQLERACRAAGRRRPGPASGLAPRPRSRPPRVECPTGFGARRLPRSSPSPAADCFEPRHPFRHGPRPRPRIPAANRKSAGGKAPIAALADDEDSLVPGEVGGLPSELAQRDAERARGRDPVDTPRPHGHPSGERHRRAGIVELFDTYLGRGPARGRLHHLLLTPYKGSAWLRSCQLASRPSALSMLRLIETHDRATVDLDDRHAHLPGPAHQIARGCRVAADIHVAEWNAPGAQIRLGAHAPDARRRRVDDDAMRPAVEVALCER